MFGLEILSMLKWAYTIIRVHQNTQSRIVQPMGYCNPFGSPASPVPRMKVQGWRVARLKGQSLSGLIQSGGFWRHICSNWSGLMHSIPFRTQNCSKCIPKLIQNGPWGPQHGVIGDQNASDGAKWTLGAPRCAQREVRVRQDGPKRSPKGPLGPKGAQEEPKVSPRGSEGAKVEAQERQNTKKLIVQNR